MGVGSSLVEEVVSGLNSEEAVASRPCVQGTGLNDLILFDADSLHSWLWLRLFHISGGWNLSRVDDLDFLGVLFHSDLFR